MKYHDHRNEPYVYCSECDRDITLEAQYSDNGHVYCGECNEEREEPSEI